ncbi:MAG: 2-amino-4-hydroxy-6-hydroxymethyldihydropteridine diphosphokinase [Thermoplasmatota archaeon]
MKAILGLGSNIEPRSNIESACQRLARDAHVEKVSRPWWTPAVGGVPGSPPFLNCVAIVETPLAPVAMRRWLRAVEHDHGRSRGDDPNAPRTLDIDVLAEDAGRGHGWSWRTDLAAEPYHLLPLADVLPTLRLADGRTVREHAAAIRMPEAFPWTDAGVGRSMERPAALEVRPGVG